MKRINRKLLSKILSIICVFSTIMLVISLVVQEEGESSYELAVQLAQSGTEAPATIPAPDATEPPAETEAPAETAPTEPKPPKPIWIPAPLEEEDATIEALKTIDLKALREVNPDVIGWIRIPDTYINYPLMQGEDNTFYLGHTWEKARNPYGSIFLESRNSPDLSDFNTIIYGHNMLNGSMFGDLDQFSYQWYVNWNKYVYLVTDDGIFRYEIFSSYSAAVDSPTYGLSFNQQQTREDFIAMALENSLIESDIVPATTDRILTLSTCTGLGYDNRRVVHAYLKMIQVQP